jgi:hypothetical protein
MVAVLKPPTPAYAYVGKRAEDGKLLPRRGVAQPRSRSHKEVIAALVGPNGEEAFAALASIMRGESWIPPPRIVDGVMCEFEPQIPNTTERRKAAVELINHLVGRPTQRVDIGVPNAPQPRMLDMRNASLAQLEALEVIEVTVEAQYEINDVTVSATVQDATATDDYDDWLDVVAESSVSENE